MKLYNVLEAFNTNNGIDSGVGKHLGSGYFSSVYEAEPPHHTAIKKMDTPDTDYAFNLYANYIIKNKLAQSNPTFPRYFNIEKEDDTIIKLEMEKLIHFKDLSDYEYELLKDNVLEYANYTITSQIADQITTGSSKLKDKNVINACDIIAKIMEDNNLYEYIKIMLDFPSYSASDNETSNIMVRRTNKLLQIVITDPFIANSAYS